MPFRDLLRRPPPPAGPLADLAAAPVYPRETPLAEVELVALDLETTGLDPRRHETLSVGLVPVHGGQVLLGGARHVPVHPVGEVGDSAVVHGLTDDALADQPPLAEVLPDLIEALTGPRRRVLLAHYARVETGFLGEACRGLYGARPELQVVDTLEVERRLLGAHLHHLRPAALRLQACRDRHHLPRYRAHSALTDAVACAELFLAQCAALEAARGRALTLGDVLGR